LRIEFLDPLVAGVDHIEVPFPVHDDIPGPVEEASHPFGPAPRIGETAPLVEVLPLRVELLEAMIPGVGHIDVPLTIDGYP